MTNKPKDKKCTCPFDDETAAEIGHLLNCPMYDTDNRYKHEKHDQET